MANTATKATRDPAQLCVHKGCGAYRMRGQTECNKHGGMNRYKRMKAQERLDRAADSVIATLIEIVTNERVDPEARIKAAKELLSHTHEVLAPGTRMHVTGASDLRPR